MAVLDERFLIIDTAHRRGQVAIAAGDRVLRFGVLEEARRHARDLMPVARELLRAEGWKAQDLTGVVVSRGPGSYTGLRVGLISAKTLAWATGCVLLGVETFAAIARQVPAEAVGIDVIADAQQDKIYVQHFCGASAEPLAIRPLGEWLKSIPPDILVSGPGLELFGDRIPPNVRRAAQEAWLQRPESLLALALERFRRGERDDPMTLEPLYLRASSAEEKWQKKSFLSEPEASAKNILR